MVRIDKPLYLPVETYAREMDAKLLLALFALREGLDVVICSSILVRQQLAQLPRGLFLLSSFQERSRNFAARLRRYGHRLMAWDEEGLVWLSAQHYARRRVGMGTLQHVECIFAWGEEQRQALLEAGVQNTILPLGNPRADLLSQRFHALHEPRVAALKQEYGDFILINSNFGWINLIGTADAPKSTEEIARMSGHPVDFIRFRQQVFASMVELAKALALRFADTTIVIRPHPSEDPQAWKKRLAGLPNVVVRYDEELIPWLLAARAMIHNGCTTAVEYALLGKVPISYDAVTHATYRPPQPHKVSLSASNVEDVVRLISQPVASKAINEALKAMIGSWATGELAAARIAKVLAERAVAARPLPLRQRLDAQLFAAKKRLARLWRPHLLGERHLAHRFPKVTPGQLQERMQQLAACLKEPVPDFAVRQGGERLFVIQRT